MSQTLELPDDLAQALTDEAQRVGLSLNEYAIRLLASYRNSVAALANGRELVDHWMTEGLIGTRADVGDSQEYARQLHEEAQRRGA